VSANFQRGNLGVLRELEEAEKIKGDLDEGRKREATVGFIRVGQGDGIS